MRFDEFLKEHSVAVSPVDQFAGFIVQVGVPRGWDLFDSAPGMRLWVCRNNPYADGFCANAVLTMHRVEASVDAGEVFTMLADQQAQLVPGCHEVHRELAAATDGDGVIGALMMRIGREVDTIESVSQSRIIATEQETLIAQLTVTTLHDSPLGQTHPWLTVRASAASVHNGAAPVTRMGHGH